MLRMGFPKSCIILLMICIFSLEIAANYQKHQIHFLQNFLDKLEFPNKIVGYLCWKKGDIQTLSKIFSQKLIAHTFTNNFIHSNFLKHGRILFMADMACDNFKEILTKSLAEKIFRQPITWIIFGNHEAIKSNNFFFPINSMVFSVENVDRHVIVKALYKYNEDNTKYIEENVTKWSFDDGFLFYNKLNVAKNRTDLRRTPIRTSYGLKEYDIVNRQRNCSKRNLYGRSIISHNLINILLESVNASKVNIWNNIQFHENRTNNSYEGLYEDLVNEKADISGTPIVIETKWLDHLKLIVPPCNKYVGFVFRAPPLSSVVDVNYKLFSPSFLQSLQGISLISCIVLYVIMSYEWKNIPEARIQYKTKPNPTDILFLLTNFFTQRIGSLEPITFPGRLIVFVVTITTTYTFSAILGFILILLQSTSDTIKDVEALYNSKFEIGLENVAYNRYYFLTPNDYTNETLRNLFYEDRIVPGGVESKFFAFEDGMERIRGNYFAYNVETEAAFHFMHNHFSEIEKCTISSVKTIYKSSHPYLVVPKNSTFDELFLVGFRKIFETGIHQREYRKFFVKKPECRGAQSNYNSISLMDCCHAYKIMGTGIISSLVIFIFEIATKFYKKLRALSKKQKQHTPVLVIPYIN